MSKKRFPGKFPTTDNTALVILFSVPHIQQQIRAVRVGALCDVGGRHWRVLDALLSVLVQIHFSHATDDTMNEPRDSQLHRVRTVRGSHCYRLDLIVFPPQSLWGRSLIALTAPKQAQWSLRPWESSPANQSSCECTIEEMLEGASVRCIKWYSDVAGWIKEIALCACYKHKGDSNGYLWSVDLGENAVSPDSSLLILCGGRSVGWGEPFVWSERRSRPGDAENIETSSEIIYKKLKQPQMIVREFLCIC